MASRGAPAGLLFILLSACSGSSDGQAEDIVFRVGATAGLSAFIPGATLQGSSAAAADLIYELGTEHIEGIERAGPRLILKRRARSRFTVQQLASSLRSQNLVSARAIAPDLIEAVFTDAASAERTDPWSLVFDVGPFKVESQSQGHARLRRRGRSAIDVIEIVEVSASDEWRKLMARELDVMSSSPALFREQFAGMASVRVLDIPATITATLFFNVHNPALAAVEVRRRIAAGLNREAIARVATGDASSARPSQAGTQGAVRLPGRLSLLALEGDSTTVLAASVIRHQLGRLGVVVDVLPVSLEEFGSRLDSGSHELALGPLPKGDRRFGRFMTPGPTTPSMTGFADPDYDAAVRRQDLAQARAILDREVPATELYEVRTFAAIDARFCGDVTPNDTSWRWMADLHLCQNDEGEGGEEEGEGATR
ncbi:MAG TPA: ABC transporter substrate-binding protein [Kofleriaceae bacterium]|nr:ABC transporter substrate-binding protein [Kofleriaceae bacterium]